MNKKSKISRLPPYIKRYIKVLILSLFAITVILLVVLYFAEFHNSEINSIDTCKSFISSNSKIYVQNETDSCVDAKTWEKLNKIQDIKQKDDFRVFMISGTASFVEDLIFFFLIGLFVFVTAARRPEDDSLENRAFFLFAGKHVNKYTRNYVCEEIERMAALSPKTDITFTLKDYCNSKKALKVHYEGVFEICNMFHNQRFENETKLSLLADQIDSEDGIIGGIKKIAINKKDSPTTDFVDLTEDVPSNANPVIGDKLEFKKNPISKVFKVEIPENSSGSFIVSAWFWNKANNGVLSIVTQRFTENLSVKVINGLENNTVLISDDGLADKYGEFLKSNASDSKELKSGEHILFNFGQITPNDKVRFSINVDSKDYDNKDKAT